MLNLNFHTHTKLPFLFFIKVTNGTVFRKFICSKIQIVGIITKSLPLSLSPPSKSSSDNKPTAHVKPMAEASKHLFYKLIGLASDLGLALLPLVILRHGWLIASRILNSQWERRVQNRKAFVEIFCRTLNQQGDIFEGFRKLWSELWGYEFLDLFNCACVTTTLMWTQLLT